MSHGENSKLLYGNLIDEAIREPTEDISPASSTKHGTEQRIGQYEIGRSLKLSHKRETKLDISLQRVERGRVVQLGERQFANDELHFNDARTWASASAIGMTGTALLTADEKMLRWHHHLERRDARV